MESSDRRNTVYSELQKIRSDCPIYKMLSDATPRVYDDFTIPGVGFEGIIGFGKFRGTRIQVIMDEAGLWVAPIVYLRDYNSKKEAIRARMVAKELEARTDKLIN